MTIKVLAISLLGIGVVFVFLLMLFFILIAFRYLFSDSNKKVEENRVSDDKKFRNVKTTSGDISEEEIAVIMTVINRFNATNIENNEIVSIKKRR